MVDALAMSFRTVRLAKDPACAGLRIGGAGPPEFRPAQRGASDGDGGAVAAGAVLRPDGRRDEKGDPGERDDDDGHGTGPADRLHGEGLEELSGARVSLLLVSTRKTALTSPKRRTSPLERTASVTRFPFRNVPLTLERSSTTHPPAVSVQRRVLAGDGEVRERDVAVGVAADDGAPDDLVSLLPAVLNDQERRHGSSCPYLSLHVVPASGPGARTKATSPTFVPVGARGEGVAESGEERPGVVVAERLPRVEAGRLGAVERRAVDERAGRVGLVVDTVGPGHERGRLPAVPAIWSAVARASSRFRPPCPGPLTVTVVSPPKSVTRGRAACAPPEVPRRGPGDGEPSGGAPRLAAQKLGDDAGIGAEPERGEPGPLESRPDVGEEDAPAWPDGARRGGRRRKGEDGADGRRDERA